MILREFFDKLCDELEVTPRRLSSRLKNRVIVHDGVDGSVLLFQRIAMDAEPGRGEIIFYTTTGRTKTYSWNPRYKGLLMASKIMDISCERGNSILGGKSKIIIKSVRTRE